MKTHPLLLLLSLASLLLLLAFTEGVHGATGAKQPWDKAARLLARENGAAPKIMDLTEKSFSLLSRAPRNYTLVVLFTALGREFQCHGCHDFEPNYRLLLDSLRRSPGLARSVFLARVEFAANRNVFSKLGLTTAPVIHVYKPTPKKELPEVVAYEFQKFGPGIEPLLDFLRSSANVDIKIVHPTDYVKLATFALALAGGAGIVYLLFVRFSALTGLWQLWMALTVVYCTVMTAGYMWNKIRTPPYMGGGRNGNVEVIAGGFSNQYEVETQIVAALYLICGTAFAGLASTGKRLHESPLMLLMCAVCLLTILFGQGVIIQLFKIKNGGYPFQGIMF